MAEEVPFVTCTVHDGSGGEAAADIAGDFPGSPVRLTFAFGCNAQHRIQTLTIRP
jgi:hypothetical protein